MKKLFRGLPILINGKNVLAEIQIRLRGDVKKFLINALEVRIL